MAFWNRKKKEESDPEWLRSIVESGLLKDLDSTIRQSTESRDRATASTVRSFQELTKALNNATKEFKRGFQK